MTRTMVFLMTLMSVLPSDGSSQAIPSSGDRIRIRQVDGTVLTGTLTTLSPETIQLSVGSDDRMAEVPMARIETLEISRGQRSNYLKYIGLTVAATSIVGATIGFIYYDPSCSGAICFTRGQTTGIGFAWGVLFGLPLGALIDYVKREERWNPVALPGLAASGLTIRPVIGSGVGFAGSIRVGGF